MHVVQFESGELPPRFTTGDRPPIRLRRLCYYSNDFFEDCWGSATNPDYRDEKLISRRQIARHAGRQSKASLSFSRAC